MMNLLPLAKWLSLSIFSISSNTNNNQKRFKIFNHITTLNKLVSKPFNNSYNLNSKMSLIVISKESRSLSFLLPSQFVSSNFLNKFIRIGKEGVLWKEENCKSA